MLYWMNVLTENSFGTVALLLQLIPILSMCFLMTTAAGSALWASDLENRRGLLAQRREPVDAAYYDEEATN